MTYCPWCAQPVLEDAVDDHGVPYHAACDAIRRELLRGELAPQRGGLKPP
jgi:hypothetical protein